MSKCHPKMSFHERLKGTPTEDQWVFDRWPKGFAKNVLVKEQNQF